MMAEAFQSGKRVALPRVRTDEAARRLDFYEVASLEKCLTQGVFGILEPDPAKTRLIEPANIDCILVPGVAFDNAGRRLGRGKGYYDRFLGGAARNAAKIGLAFSFQLIERVPAEAHDQRVDEVITD